MSTPLLIVRIAGDRIAVPAERVHSVVELGRIVPVPRAPREAWSKPNPGACWSSTSR